MTPGPSPPSGKTGCFSCVQMERVRQWEVCLLQDIEEAVQHELTVEVE